VELVWRVFVNVGAEADGLKAEAENLIAKARSEAEDILVRSRLEGENSLAHSRAKGEEHRQQLEGELGALRDQAETRMRELQADTEAVWKDRHQLLDDIRGRASPSWPTRPLPASPPSPPSPRKSFWRARRSMTSSERGPSRVRRPRTMPAAEPRPSDREQAHSVEQESGPVGRFVF